MARALLTLAVILSASPLAPAAQPVDRGAGGVPESNRYLRLEDEKTWVVRSMYFVYPGVVQGRRVHFNAPFSTIEIVAPFVERSAASWLPETPRTQVAVGINIAAGDLFNPKILRAPSTGAPYASFRLNQAVDVTYLWYEVETEVVCAETEFDEKAAWDLPWPASWPPEAEVWLASDPVYDVPDETPEDEVLGQLQAWVDGADPKKLPPVQLAKFLTGSVIEHMRINRRPVDRPDSTPARVISTGAVPGGVSEVVTTSTLTSEAHLQSAMGAFNIQNASESVSTRRGSEHDLSNLLTAVLRRAGLPARTVIGVDNEEGGDERLKSWVEFALVAPDVEGVIWVPIDVWELKGAGRRARDYRQVWEHFGTCEMLRHTAPISFYFHPPANYRAWQGAGLFGVKGSDELPEYGRQAAMFVINGKANRNP